MSTVKYDDSVRFAALLEEPLENYTDDDLTFFTNMNKEMNKDQEISEDVARASLKAKFDREIINEETIQIRALVKNIQSAEEKDMTGFNDSPEQAALNPTDEEIISIAKKVDESEIDSITPTEIRLVLKSLDLKNMTYQGGGGSKVIETVVGIVEFKESNGYGQAPNQSTRTK